MSDRFPRTAFVAVLIVLMIASWAPTVLANAAPPRLSERGANSQQKPNTRSATMPMKVTRVNAKETRIRIPANLLAKGNDKLGFLIPASGDGLTNLAAVDSNTTNGTGLWGTMIAGLAMAAALGCGFVIFGRRITPNKTLATAAVLLLSTVCFIGGVTADIPIIGETFQSDKGPRDLPVGFEDPFAPAAKPAHKIVVEIVPNGKSVELVIGSDATWAK